MMSKQLLFYSRPPRHPVKQFRHGYFATNRCHYFLLEKNCGGRFSKLFVLDIAIAKCCQKKILEISHLAVKVGNTWHLQIDLSPGKPLFCV